MNRKLKKMEWNNVNNVFTVTFDQLNASLLNKSINSIHKKKKKIIVFDCLFTVQGKYCATILSKQKPCKHQRKYEFTLD